MSSPKRVHSVTAVMKRVTRVPSMNAAILRLYTGVGSASRVMNCECIADCLAAKLLLWASGPWGTISDMKGLRRARPLVKDVLGEMPPAMVARFCLAFMSPSVGRMDTITSLELAHAEQMGVLVQMELLEGALLRSAERSGAQSATSSESEQSGADGKHCSDERRRKLEHQHLLQQAAASCDCPA